MNTLQFFTPQNYHIAIIHLHVVFKCIESSEKLGGTVQMCSTTIPPQKRGGGGKDAPGCVNQWKHSLLHSGSF